MPRKARTPLHAEGANPEYKVGYKKPPRTPKGGPSRNPKGRPKKDKENLGTIIKRVDGMPVTYTVQGKSSQLTATEALLVKIRKKMLDDGDLAAARLWLDYMNRYVSEPAETEQQILERTFAGAREELAKKLDALRKHYPPEGAAAEPTEPSPK